MHSIVAYIAHIIRNAFTRSDHAVLMLVETDVYSRIINA